MKIHGLIRSVCLIVILGVCILTYQCALAGVLTLPSGTKVIEEEAFYGDTSLDEVVLPDGVEEIGAKAFQQSSVSVINLPDSLTSIADDAFDANAGIEFTANEGTYARDWIKEHGYELALQESPVEDFIFTYNYWNGTCNISGYTGSDTEIVIPKKNSGGEIVFGIEDDAFKNCNSLTSITIPEGVTSIGVSAFWGCSSLTSISLPKSLTSIGDTAFMFCNNLSNIRIGSIKTWLNINYANYSSHPNFFSSNCHLFIGNEEMSNIVIPEGVTSICDYAFHNCSSLRSITLPEGVTSIGERALSNCSSLTSIILPEGVTNLGYEAFSYCSSLTSIILPESITTIGRCAFYGCKSLKSIMLPEHLISIQDGTFNYCQSLTSITIPESVTSIGDNAFSSCGSLTSITIGSIESWVTINYGNDSSHPNYCASDCHLFIENEEITNISITEGVTSIADYAFYNCGNLTSITLPESLTNIGNKAFYGCYNLTSITIPEGVTSIADYALYNCGNLTSITLPESLTNIGNKAFSGCYNLTSITIPEGVTSIGDSTFEYCYNLTSITIPEGVTSIGHSTFSGCSSLTSITIPEGVTSIGHSTFSGCSSLTSITIPEGVTSIGDSAFHSCSSLTSITLPKRVTSIGNYTFEYCYSLESIIIPEGVTSIGRYVFYGCESLVSITLPESVTSIDVAAFGRCWSLKNITLQEGVTSIGASAFSWCYSLMTITIPEGVTSIGESAFYDCKNMTSIVLPESVTSIGDSVFRNHSPFLNIYCVHGSFAWQWCVDHACSYYLAPWNGIAPKVREAKLTGKLCLEDGTPISDAVIYISHPTEGLRTIVVGADGSWDITGLTVGEIYDITIDSPYYTFESTSIEMTGTNQDTGEINGNPADEYLTTDAANIKAEASGGKYTIKIKSNLSWSLSTEDSWITLSSTEGTGNAEITVTIPANPEDAVRIGKITVSTGESSGDLSVAQVGSTKKRLEDPAITAPAEDNLVLEYGAVEVRWTEVPYTDHYIVSLRDLDTNALILNHSIRVGESGLSTVLTPEYFGYGGSYRLAIGAVPAGFESTDSLVSWKERLFSISEEPASEETWIYGRTIEYDENDQAYPVAGVTLNLYLDSTDETGENTSGETAECLATVYSEIDGTWVFHNLEPEKDYVIVASRTPRRVLKSGNYSTTSDVTGKTTTHTASGGNNAGDIPVNMNEEINLSESGLWAKYYNYTDKNTFDDESLRYVNVVKNIDFTFGCDTDQWGNLVLNAKAYNGSGTNQELANYVRLNQLGIEFTGYLNLPAGLGETEIRLRGDDGISLQVGQQKQQWWEDKGLLENSKTIKVDTQNATNYKLTAKYFNNTGEAKLIMEYRYKIGSKWSEWKVIPENYLSRGAAPSINPTLSYWLVKEKVDELDESLNKYVNVTCGDIIQNVLTGEVMSGLTDFALGDADANLFAGKKGFLSSFGTLATTGIGKAMLDTAAEALGVAITPGLTGEDKAEEVKKKVFALCKIAEEDEGKYILDVTYEDGIKSVVGILEFIDRYDFVSDPGIQDALHHILLFDIEPTTGRIYDPTDTSADKFVLSDYVENFFSIYNFAKGILNMYKNAVEGAKGYQDTNRIKSFMYLCAWNYKVHGIELDADFSKIISDTQVQNDLTTKNYISNTKTTLEDLYKNPERTRMLNNNSLSYGFSESIKSYSGVSWEMVIYKQLLLDVMDNYIDNFEFY